MNAFSHWIPRLLSIAVALTTATLRAQTVFAPEEDPRFTNESRVLVPFDADDGDNTTNRHLLNVHWPIRFNATVPGTYRVIYTLVDRAGQTVPLVPGPNVTGNTCISTSLVIEGSPGAKPRLHTFPTAFQPVSPEAFTASWRITASLQRWTRITTPIPRYVWQTIATGAAPASTTFYFFPAGSSPDPQHHVVGSLRSINLASPIVFTSAEGNAGFRMTGSFRLLRYDDYTEETPRTDNIPFTYRLRLTDTTTGETVPLASPEHTQTIPVPTYSIADGGKIPYDANRSIQLDFIPADWTHIHPTRPYQLTVSLSYLDPHLGDTLLFASTTAPTRLLALSGSIRFGSLITGTYTALSNDPRAGLTDNGDGSANGSLVIPSGNGRAGDAGGSFGNGVTPLQVTILPNGDAVCTGGSLPLQGDASAAGAPIRNLPVTRSGATLGASGLSMNLRLSLPSGLGYSHNPASRRLHHTAIWNAIPCGPDFVPLPGELTRSAQELGSTTSLSYAVKDGIPARMAFSKLTWLVHEGRIHLGSSGDAIPVRSDEDIELGASMWTSNDGHFRFVRSWKAIHFDADVNGRALLSGGFSFDNGAFQSHFPDRTEVAWGAEGYLVLSEDRILPEQSRLHGAKYGRLPYQRGFPRDGNCAMVEERLVPFDPEAEHYAFTSDGGLSLPVKLATPEPLSWGKNGDSPTYAHRLAPLTSGRLLIAGHRLRGSAFNPSENPAHKPATLLLSGHGSPDDETRVERPDLTAGSPYRQGEADYPGLNFRVTLDQPSGNRTASSRLGGGDVGPYALHEAAKYYARSGGVSGRHQSAAAPAGQPSPFSSLLLFGFQCNFDGMKLGYLDNDNVFSLSNGRIEVPGPSNFDQEIERLRFDGAGRPKSAELAGQNANRLQHWAADFTPLTFRFQPKVGGGCPSFDDGVLAMGAEVDASALTSQPLYGELGFYPDGHLVPKGEAGSYAGLSSELMLPAQLRIHGGQVPFVLAPHGKAYFSAAGGSPQPGEGWINLYGALDVPFFQDIKVQLHVLNASNPGGGILHIMGGWPASDGAANQYGWHVNQQTPFNDPLFDGSQRGYPEGVSLANYRSPAAGERNYRPRAEQDWLEVVSLGYSLQWEGATKRFVSTTDEEREFLILSMQHRLLNLTSTTAEITFGAKVDAFPAINPSKLLSAQLDGAFGNLMDNLTQQGLQVTGLNDAVRSFDALLSTQWLDVLEAPLLRAFNDPSFPIDLPTWAENPTIASQAYASQIYQIAGASGEFTAELNTRIQHIIDALRLVQGLIPADGNVNILGSLVEAVLSQTDLHPSIRSHLAQIIQAATAETELNRSLPAFRELRATTDRLVSQLQTLKSQLNSATSLRAEIDSALKDKRTEYETLIRTRLTQYFAPFQGRVDLAIAERGEAAIRREINRIAVNAMLGNSAAGPVQAAIKLHLGETQASFRGVLDSLFGEVNRCIRTAVSITDGIDLPGLDAVSYGAGAMAQVFRGASLDGYAQIIGDSLQRMRVDGKLALKAADDMEFHGWFQIDALNANNPRSACYCGDVTQARGAEVIIGGQAPISIFGSTADIRVEGLFAFGACSAGDSIGLMGLAGSMGLEGELKISGVTIQEIGFGFSFGQASNYIQGKARASFKGYEFAAALFAGSSCGLGPLVDTDKDIAQLFIEPGVGIGSIDYETTRLTGFYTYAEGWIPLNEYIGIPDSCMLSLRAGMGFGPFAFVVTDPSGNERLALGAKYLLGIEARVLCVAKLGAKAKLMGAVSANWPLTVFPPTFDALLENDLRLRLRGTATFSATIGPCPLCKDFEKDVKFHANVSKQDTGFGFGH